MGWTTNEKWKTPGDACNAALREIGNIETSTDLIGEDAAWVAWAITLRNNKRSIELICIERERGVFSYKTIGESEEPYHYNVPQEYAVIADPPVTESAARWRRLAFPGYVDTSDDRRALLAIADLLYPASDPRRQWDVETIETVSEIIERHPELARIIKRRCDAADGIDPE